MDGSPRKRRAPARAPPRNRPGRPRSEQTHAALLGSAIVLIRELGYDAVSIEAIAARAGASKAAVYRRWPSKELLVSEAMERIVRRIAVPDTGRVEGDVLALMATTTAMYRAGATAGLLSGLVAAMARSRRLARAVRKGFIAQWRQIMRKVLRRGAERGELRADLDVEIALDLLSGPAFYRFLMLGKTVDERFALAVVKTVLRGLAPTGGQSVQRP